jgi:4-hydroxy-tetrahydrodipicolinate reductase
MIDIILHGCHGRMGRAVAEAVANFPEMNIAFGVDRNQTGQPSGQYSFPVFYPIATGPKTGDVIIDFSSHEAIADMLNFAISRQLPLVIASTGITEEEQAQIHEASRQIPVFQAPNFSIGINLLAACIELILPVLEQTFDVEIIDKHHREKKDAPSGTALQLAEVARVYSTTGKEIGITSLRAGTIPGEHTVIFAGNDEIIELKHTAMSRDVFAQGALKAAKFLVGKPAGRYNMKNLIEG